MNSKSNATAAALFSMEWDSAEAHHCDRLYTENINFWRDVFPAGLRAELLTANPGDEVCLNYDAGELVPGPLEKDCFELARHQFGANLQGNDKAAAPHAGRFYPKGCLLDVPNVFKQNIQPFRCTGVSPTRLQVDFNRPMAGRAVKLWAQLHEIASKPVDRGGTLIDWTECLSDGPGIQARWRSQATDFFTGNPFARQDETPDATFYASPRLVNHLDTTAIEHIRELYGKLLRPGSRVLDLMSSWTSHLPENLSLRQVSGLGMNAHELQQNGALTDYRVHDLNQNPLIPYSDQQYDAVICSASIEYLTRPQAVFNELARVLRPGGLLAISFSNRWFAPKTIQLWPHLHEFERVGLVAELFLQNGQFENLNTLSIRGFPRPDDDKYADQIFYSDPVYAVWGARRDGSAL